MGEGTSSIVVNMKGDVEVAKDGGTPQACRKGRGVYKRVEGVQVCRCER